MSTKFVLFVCLLLIALPLAGCLSSDDDGGEPGDGTDMEGHHAIMAKARDVAADLDTPEKALAAGYVPDAYCIPGMGVHWINFDAFDTEFDPEVPEVVMFLPDSHNVEDTEGDKFLGIEYVVVTEGTDMNSTDSVPTFHGVKFDGPMPGHSPDMPWHAELHIYLAEGHESSAEFHGEHPDVKCPEGTTPGDAGLVAKARELAGQWDTGAKALEAGYVPTAVCEPGQGVHWVNLEAFDPVLEEDVPEVLLFLPGPGGIYDTANSTLIGVEWVVVTEGTENNETGAVVLHGRAFDGPMPGHFPGMPWHAELHVWLGPEGDWSPFGDAHEDDHGGVHHAHPMVECPDGTGPPPPMANANLRAVTPEGVGDNIRGTVNLTEGPFLGSLTIEISVEGLTEGEHGVHIHVNGDCSPAGTDGPVAAGAAGGHFNPDNNSHGEHAGDLGNITVGPDGTGFAVFQAQPLTLEPGAKYSVLNRSVIVHQDRDDGETDPSGNSGPRVLCGVIAAA